MADPENTAAPATEAPAANGSAESEAPANTVESKAGEGVAANNVAEETKEVETEEKANGATKRKANDKDDDKDSKRPRKDHRNPREQRSEYNKNVKTDYTKLEESEDPEEIRKQVEFYFSDSNLPMDTYLYNLVGGAENKSVPVKVIHSFKRMKRYQPYSAVVAALKESEILDLSGDAGKEEIKRKVPLVEGTKEESYKAYEDKTMPRSIYVKGFGNEGPSTQFDLEEFFAPYGPINSVRMRRTYPEKVFKGSVFVEFDSEDTSAQFLALDPKPKFDGKDLVIMSKKAYTDMKSEDIRQGKIKPNNERSGYHDRHGNKDRRDQRGGRRDGGRGRDGRNGRDRDRDDWKGRRDDFQKRKGGRDEDGVLKCYACGEPGHRKNDCPGGGSKRRHADEDDEASAKKPRTAGSSENKSEEVKEVTAEA